MKLHFLFLLCSVIGLQVLLAQKEDYSWVMGNGTLNVINFDESDYVNDTMTVAFPYNRVHRTSAAISDSVGRLLMYSGGTSINNRDGDVLVNGDSISKGFIQETWGISGAYGFYNGAMFLTVPNSINEYLLLNIRADTILELAPLDDGFGLDVLYQKVLYNPNLDDLEIIEKNVSIIQDTLNANGIAACRHGNGRDWWVVVGEAGNNCYQLALLTPNGFENVLIQCIGVKSEFQDIGQLVFSADGSLLIRGSIIDGVEVFDFDRCSGLVSNARHITTVGYELSPSNQFIGNVCVSPSSQVLYVGASGRIYQYDLQANDIKSTELLIHNRDTAAVIDYLFLEPRLAPNGKIYFSGGMLTNWHEISSPNVLGIGCGLIVKKPLIAGGSNGLPNFPNYRLGRLTGSECDTLFNDTVDVVHSLEIRSLLKLYPNPTNGRVRLEYGNFLWRSNDELQVAITNTLGQLIVEEQLAQYSLYKDYDVSEWNGGLYWVSLYNRGELVGIKKLMVD